MAVALLVDLDDTLLDDRQAMADAVLALRVQHGLAPHEDPSGVAQRWDAVTRAIWVRQAAGELSHEEQRRERLRSTFSLDVSDAEADAIFECYLQHYEAQWNLLPGALEFLERTNHLPRALVTNGRRLLVERKLRSLGLEGKFRAVVTPDDCGTHKPDPKIFLFALQQLGHQPHEALMIGDSYAHDIAPALALGMRAFHIDAAQVGRSIAHAPYDDSEFR